MTTIKTHKVESSLTKKGFVKKETHHTYYTYYIEGKKTSIQTYVSHGCSEVNLFLQRKMAEQMCISVEEFRRFVECTLSQEKYEEILRKKDAL